MTRPKSHQAYKEQLAEMFINILEEKSLNWKSGISKLSFNQHHNAISKHIYKGSNILLLTFVALKCGYNDPRWVTMNQIMDKQGKYHPNEKWHLQKGSKATYVEYWYPFDKQLKKVVDWSEFKQDDPKYVLCSKYTAVFNASCVEGMPEMEVVEKNNIAIDEIVKQLAENMNVPIVFGAGFKPHYRPFEDKIYMPTKELYDNTYTFNATVLHELAHSTGHNSRLNRPLCNEYGSEEYAYEELVAEISACFISAELKSEQSEEHINNHKAYVQSWIKALKKDPDFLVHAVKDAEEVAKYMDNQIELNKTLEEAEELEMNM